MPRILAIDYGTKKIGTAVTDPLQIIGTALETVDKEHIMSFLERYFEEEEVEAIVVGDPLHADGSPAQIAPLVKKFIKELQKQFPEIPVFTFDERYTSEEAREVILQSGASKKKRRDKRLVDKVSAAIILERYMVSIGKW